VLVSRTTTRPYYGHKIDINFSIFQYVLAKNGKNESPNHVLFKSEIRSQKDSVEKKLWRHKVEQPFG
jgi:hypothetical protein